MEEMQKYLKEILSESRYKHSLGVMEKAEELAKIYKVDIESAKKVGLLHDIAKEMTIEQYKEYANKNNIKITEQDEMITAILHAKIGAHICKEKFGFTEEMQDAVRYHTTGRAGMSMLEKIIYVADKVEEGRKYDGVQELRKLAEENIDEVIMQIVDFNLMKAVNNRNPIHPLSIEMRNELIKNEKSSV